MAYQRGTANAGRGEGDLSSLRTRLVQRTIGALDEVHDAFSNTGQHGDEICLVAVPRLGMGSMCYIPFLCLGGCFHCLVNVPSGPYVLWQSFGADQGQLAAGGKACWAIWKHVSHLVSKATVVYNAKPKSCPTADSVFVDVDLSVNIRIGPDIERVQTFVFEMGAERLDAYLHFQVEESIRSLVFSVTHDKVNDLRSEFANEML